MGLWIPITIAAAFMQNLRLVLQKAARGRLTTEGATFARFVWAAPLACALVLGLVFLRGDTIPNLTAPFLFYAVLGGLAQILATICLVALLALRNFAIGVSFSKTEVVQTAVFGLLILGETAGPGAFVAILLSLVGVLLISTPPGAMIRTGLFNRAAGIGVASGALFGISAVGVRAASLSLPDGDFLIRAAVTLACVTLFQTVAMWLWLTFRQPGQVARVFTHWRLTLWVGVTGMLGSLGWFTAMTLQNAAYVRALGQVELVFTFAASYFFLKETSTGREVSGVMLVVAGLLVLVLLG